MKPIQLHLIVESTLTFAVRLGCRFFVPLALLTECCRTGDSHNETETYA